MQPNWRIWSTNSKANQHQWPQGLQKPFTIAGERVSSKNNMYVQTQRHVSVRISDRSESVEELWGRQQKLCICKMDCDKCWACFCFSSSGVCLMFALMVGHSMIVSIMEWLLVFYSCLHTLFFFSCISMVASFAYFMFYYLKWKMNWKIFFQLSLVRCLVTEALLFSPAGPPGRGLRRVWPQLPESRLGVLLVSEEPHGRTLGKHHARPSSTRRSHGVLFGSGLIDSSTVTTPSPAWISPPTTPVSWPWGWSMGPLPSMMCRLWRTRRVSSAAGEEQPPSVISCLPVTVVGHSVTMVAPFITLSRHKMKQKHLFCFSFDYKLQTSMLQKTQG